MKVIKKYYPETNIASFKLARVISVVVSTFAYILSIGGYVGFLIPTSLQAKEFAWALMIPFIALAIMVVINALGLLFVAVYSFNYNKAILLEKNEANTHNTNNGTNTENKPLSKADEIREFKKTS